MVMLSVWPWTAPDLTICSDVPMSGEGTGLGVPAPALAGYLGKSPDACPWCAAKGQSHSLRSYRMNHQESVTLCTNPACLFPLVSKPPEDVLASCATGRKRKTPASPKGGCFMPPQKHPRLQGPEPAVREMCRPCVVDLSSSTVTPRMLRDFMKTGSQPQKENLSDRWTAAGLPQTAGKASEVTLGVETVTECAVGLPVVEVSQEEPEPLKEPFGETELGMRLCEEPDVKMETVARSAEEVMIGVEEEQKVVGKPVALAQEPPVLGVKLESTVEMLEEDELTVKVQLVEELAVRAKVQEVSTVEVQAVEEPAVRAKVEEVSTVEVQPVEEPAVRAKVEEVSTVEVQPVEDPAVRAKVEEVFTVEVQSVEEPAVGAGVQEVSTGEVQPVEEPAVRGKVEDMSTGEVQPVEEPAIGAGVQEVSTGEVQPVEEPAVGAEVQEVSTGEVQPVEEPAVGAGEQEVSTMEVQSVKEPAVGAEIEEVSTVEVQPVKEPAVRAEVQEVSTVEVQPVEEPAVRAELQKVSTGEVQTVEEPAVRAEVEEVSTVEEPAVRAEVEEVSTVEEPAVRGKVEDVSTGEVQPLEEPAVGAGVQEVSTGEVQPVEEPAVGAGVQEVSTMEVQPVEEPAVGAEIEEVSTVEVQPVEEPALGVTLEEDSIVEVQSMEEPALGVTLEEDCIMEVQPVEEPVLSVKLEKEAVVKVDEEFVAVSPHFFWKNKQNLCWLHTLLVALVHCRSLWQRAVGLPDNTSVIARLIASYDRICSSVKGTQPTDYNDDVLRVPAAVIHRTQRELDDLRMSTFKLLQPKLQCKLGEKETPVFAMPLLLRLDSWAEGVFHHSYEWDFTCSVCGHTFSNRCEKTLSTFPHVVPEWHPLNAVHVAQCSRCHHKHQRRKMVLERVSLVFALHFVEGLPHSDVEKYTFHIGGKRYTVTTVIQYDQHIKHFVTWLRAANGSWLEFDDLKHPQCTCHKTLPVPAGQIHVVFWEVQEPAEDSYLGDLSMSSLHNDTDIVNALTVDSGDSGRPFDSTVSDSVLKDAFEGLSHDDIVTLTLVEVNVDAKGRTLSFDHGPGEDGPRRTDPRLPAHSPVSTSKKPAKDGIPNSQRPEELQRRGRNHSSKQEEVTLPTVAGSPPSQPSVIEVSSACTPASSTPNGRWSALLSRHTSFQPSPLFQGRAPAEANPQSPLDSNLPLRSAELFVGFKSVGGALEPKKQNDAFKIPAAAPSPGAKPRAVELSKVSPKLDPVTSPVLKGQEMTDRLRHKLLKKLKAKKKKLAALNQLLKKGAGDQAATPDSTAFGSPSTVTSSTSTCSPAYSDFLSDYLSPATASSNHSPDSTGLLELLANGQEVGGAADRAGSILQAPPSTPMSVNPSESVCNGLNSETNDFLEEFLSGSCTSESADLSTLDLFF